MGEDEPVSGRPGSDAFYRALFDANPAIKMLIDPTDGALLDVNEAAVAFYGWSREQLLSMKITDINVLSLAEVRAEMDAARSGKRRYFRFRHRVQSGEIRHVEVHSGPVEIDGRELLFSIVHDVTASQRLEAQLRESQKLEAVGRLAGGIAHDFNNLLTVILHAADAIAPQLEEGSTARARLGDLIFAAERAAEISGGLLAFGRGQLLRPEELQLARVLDRMVDLLRRVLPTSIAVALDVEAELPTVRTDPAQIEQVIMNLALNAKDAMPNGGHLSIRASARRVGERDLSPVPVGDWCLVRVTDDGEGMDEATRRRVFEPFFSTKRNGGGSGLGLATAFGVINQSGGTITVESEPGQGATFTIYLPASSPEEALADA